MLTRPHPNYAQALISLIVLAALFALSIGAITAIAEGASELYRTVTTVKGV